jgi:hydroxymethylbilane synthase
MAFRHRATSPIVGYLFRRDDDDQERFTLRGAAVTPARTRRSPRDGVLRIASRSSELALRQARLVEAALATRGVKCEIVPFKTTGDKRLDEPLSAIGGKGLFTRELEEALAKGRVDCCVHSLKDLPTDWPEGLAITAILEREDPRDVLVVNDGIFAESIADLPRGSRVGTSSLRRRAMLASLRPDVDAVELRGNVPTRLRKVDDGQVHAAILAGAGLLRLGVHQRIDAWLEPPGWLPAPGQGAIAVQSRADDSETTAILAPLDHAPTRAAVTAERSFLAALEGGCQVPIGALATHVSGSLVLHGLIAELSGRRVLRGSVSVDPSCAESGGRQLASTLLDQGAGEILAVLREKKTVPMPQPE